jgi:hypothetical protein
MLSSQRKTAREWETGTFMKNIGVRAAPAGIATVAAPEGVALESPLAPTSATTHW